MPVSRDHDLPAASPVFVENLWYYDDLIADHTREKLLPDASMELIIDLGDSPKKLAGFEWVTLAIRHHRAV